MITHIPARKYDPLGNILSLAQTATGNGFTRKFTYFEDVNTLEKIETGNDALIQGFTYDAAGNQLTAGDNRHYVRNAANQLISYYNQAGSANPTVYAQYDYDSSGNRVSKVVRTGTDISPVFERTIYIEGIFEYHIRENGTTVEKNSVHVIDDKSRIAMVRIGNAFPDDISDEVTYVLEDQIGSSTSRLNTTGAEIDKEEYFPFGDASLRTFSKKRYRYTGKEKDAESGLYYYGARYYAAWTCRFISVDPLAAQYAHLSAYNYASNSPVGEVDVDGMQNRSEQTSPEGGGTENTTSSPNTQNNVVDSIKTDGVKTESSFLDDWNKGVKGFNEDWHTRMYSILNEPIKAAETFTENLVQFVTDITLVSNLMGVENKTNTALNQYINHVSELPNMDRSDQIRFGLDATTTVATLLISKRITPPLTKTPVISSAPISLTTSEGFLFRGFTVKSPFNIPVQRFGNMSFNQPDFWGTRIGTSRFANRTFAAIHPKFGNPLTQYTTGVIPKGTPIKIGIIGPQGWKYPGGSFQFVVPSRSVINQSSKTIPR